MWRGAPASPSSSSPSSEVEADPLRRRADRCRLATPLALQSGAVLDGVEISFETYGTLSPERDNAVLLLHSLTADEHAAGPAGAGHLKPGWWNAAIGPGLALDTDRYFVIAAGALGGRRSTGPGSVDPATGRPYGLAFPVVTVADMVRADLALLDGLGIGRLHAVVGGCLGGFAALAFMALAPERAGRAVVIGATARTSAHNIALFNVLRAAVMADPAFRGGDYGSEPPAVGLGLLAKVGALFWMSRETWQSRFGTASLGERPRYTLEPDFAAEDLLERVGSGATGGVLDPNAFIYLTRAMDYFDLARDHGSLQAAFADWHAPLLLVSYTSDWRYPPVEMAEIAAALPQDAPCRHLVLDSALGHGAFLYEFGTLAPELAAFLNGRPV